MEQFSRLYILQIAQEVRCDLELIWPDWHRARGRKLPSPLSHGTCQTSSLFLAKVLCHNGLEANVVQGNDVARNEGFYYGHKWHGHAWVECSDFVIDITGDQFDLPRVHLERVGSSRYKAGTDTATDDAKRQRGELVHAALLAWGANKKISLPLVGRD